jgi:hypothetical protein
VKRCLIILAIATATVALGWAAFQAAAPPQPALSTYVPAGALLYLEAKDFSGLVSDWNSSPQKRDWVESANYEVFSRSRLFLRLKGAGDQFAAAAGLPPDMNFLSQVAGTRSALALYDIGNLQFLYITYLPSAKSMQGTLWQTRAKFEPRNAGGVAFYVRRDPESQKEVAFAVAGDYLLLATRENLLAGALQLMSGGKDRTIETEQWWSQSVAAAGSTGDLRMVLNLEKLVPSPYFRTYWVQQNITDLKQYSAAVSDLFRPGKEYREERVLIQKKLETDQSAPPPSARDGRELVPLVPGGGDAVASDLVRLVPENAGFYEARAYPSPDACFQLLETKLLAPHLGPAPPSKLAPSVQLSSGEAGSGSDLETRIDQSPLPAAAPKTISALKQLLDKTSTIASLEVQFTDRDKTGVFVRTRSAIVLASGSEWDQSAVQSALVDFIQPGMTASRLGVAWQAKTGYQQLDGLWPLAVAAHGKDLVVSDDPALVESILANFNRKVEAKPAVLVAGFNHARERENFGRFFGLVDGPHNSEPAYPGMSRRPQFFSGNMASLSAALSAVTKENIVVRSDGNKILQTVTYEWAR